MTDQEKIKIAQELKELEKQSIEQLEQQAESGNPIAQFVLAGKYEMGQDVDKNLEKAFYWCQQVAKKGFSQAQFNLGTMYLNGKGVEQVIRTKITI